MYSGTTSKTIIFGSGITAKADELLSGKGGAGLIGFLLASFFASEKKIIKKNKKKLIIIFFTFDNGLIFVVF